MPLPEAPPRLEAVSLPTGVHSRYLNFLIFGPWKAGKGLPPETNVLTPRGWKPLGSLRVGDHVVDSNGEPTEVLAVYRRAIQPCYRIHFQDGTSIVTDESHLWRIERRQPRVPSTILSTRDLYYRVREDRGGEPAYIPTVAWKGNDNSLPVDPYLLGLLIGDGGLTGSTPVLTCADPEIIPKLAELFPEGEVTQRTPISFAFTRIKGGPTQNPLTLALTELELMGKRSHEKAIPEIYLTAKLEDRIALLQGLMDSDGSNEGNSIRYCTTSSDLMDDFLHLVWSVGGCTQPVREKEPHYTGTDGEKKPGRKAYNVALRLPHSTIPFRGQRRHHYNARNRTKEPRRLIQSVERTLDRETICISVAHPNGLYVVENFVVTHNSFFLSHMPKPLVAIDCGEGGLSSYLPQDDPDYKCFSITHPELYNEAVEWCLKHADKINSVAVDPITELWDDHRDYHAEQLGVEDIKGGHWKTVKVPWKLNLRRLMRAPFHVGYAAWIRETLFTEDTESAGPGEKGPLVIRPQAVPQIERTVGYTIDMIFEAACARDRLNRLTGQHEVTFWGGRRPRSVPPEMLHVGKKWTFNSKKPKSPWEEIVTPILPRWDDGAVDTLGLDPQVGENTMDELNRIAQDHAVGQLLRLMDACEAMADYKKVYEEKIAPEWNSLSSEGREQIAKRHEERKEELS